MYWCITEQVNIQFTRNFNITECAKLMNCLINWENELKDVLFENSQH